MKPRHIPPAGWEYEDSLKIRALRRYYRNNFVNGDSAESFLVWIETWLKESGELDAVEKIESGV